MTNNELTYEIRGAAFAVHRELGPGLLESAYEAALRLELELRGLEVAQQVYLPVRYKGTELNVNYRMDLTVNRAVIVEVKALREVVPLHRAQLLSYLRLADMRIGLLMNFNVTNMQTGIERLVHRL
jgi:GxxExxY protein